MKAKHYLPVLAIVSLLLPTLWAVVHAGEKPDAIAPQQSLTSQSDILRGLGGVYVIVGALKPEVERLGLTRDALQTDTELQLRQYGIKVLSRQEWLANARLPFLSVCVTTSTPDESFPAIAVNIAVELCEEVSLTRNPALRMCVATWQCSGVCQVGCARIPGVRPIVKDRVAEFINDYLAANPKQPAPTQDNRTPQ